MTTDNTLFELNLSIINSSDPWIFSSQSNQFHWPVLGLSVLALFGTLGNLLVCAAISLDKQLQTITNWFLFSLAIADCLVSLIVLPISIIKDFQGSWRLPIVLCNIYVFLDVLLCTTSIWHLTVLSIDRFLHISHPFWNRKRSKCKTFLTIILIWTFSIAISCTILILGFADERNISVINDQNKRFCTLNNPSFIIYGSIICFCVPCILMLVTYSLTIRRLQEEAAKCYTDPEDHAPVRSPRTSDRLRRHRSSSKIRSSSKKSSFKDSIQFSTTVTETEQKSSHLEWPYVSPPRARFRSTNFSFSSLSPPSSPIPSTEREHQRSFFQNTFVQKAVHAFKGGTETTSERRAMKVLGIVFFVFLVAWLPFSILNILSAVCPSCGIQTSFLNLTSWLGYISSNLNPVSNSNISERSMFVFLLSLSL